MKRPVHRGVAPLLAPLHVAECAATLLNGDQVITDLSFFQSRDGIEAALDAALAQ